MVKQHQLSNRVKILSKLSGLFAPCWQKMPNKIMNSYCAKNAMKEKRGKRKISKRKCPPQFANGAKDNLSLTDWQEQVMNNCIYDKKFSLWWQLGQWGKMHNKIWSNHVEITINVHQLSSSIHTENTLLKKRKSLTIETFVQRTSWLNCQFYS